VDSMDTCSPWAVAKKFPPGPSRATFLMSYAGNTMRFSGVESYGAYAMGLGAAEPDGSIVQRHTVDLGPRHIDLLAHLACLRVQTVHLRHLGVGAPKAVAVEENAVGPVAQCRNRPPDFHGRGVDQIELSRRRHRYPHVVVVTPLHAVGACDIRCITVAEPNDSLAWGVIVRQGCAVGV